MPDDKNLDLKSLSAQEARLCKHILEKLIAQRNKKMGQPTSLATKIDLKISSTVDESHQYPDIVFGISLLKQLITPQESEQNDKTKGVMDAQTGIEIGLGANQNIVVHGNTSKLDHAYSKIKDILREKQGYNQELFTEGEAVKKVKGRESLFIFNRETGAFKLNDTESSWSEKSKRFNLIDTFFNSKYLYARYEDIAVRVFNKPEGTNVSSGIKDETRQILDKAKHDLEILPKNEAKNEDIFYSRENSGYVIKVK